MNRDEILAEIDHGLTDQELEKRLRELVYVDILARGTIFFLLFMCSWLYCYVGTPY